MDPMSETEALLFFVSTVNFLTMATNAELFNSVNWRSIKTNLCLKIFFNMYSLSSDHGNHTCYEIKVM